MINIIDDFIITSIDIGQNMSVHAKKFRIGKANFIIFFDPVTTFSIFYIKEKEHAMKLNNIYLYTLAITLECYNYDKNTIRTILDKLKDINYCVKNNKEMAILINNKIKNFKRFFLKEIKTTGTANIEQITDIINSESSISDNQNLSPKSIYLNQLIRRENFFH